MILSKTRARKVNKVASGSAWALTLTVERELAYDVDMRGPVGHQAHGMALFFRDQHRRGERADGGRLDTVSGSTKDIEPRAGDQMGYRSGYQADHWWQGKLRGSAFRAQRIVKPYGGRAGPRPKKPTGLERDQLLNVLLKRGIDFQGIKGKANKRARKLFGESLRAMVGENPGVPIRRKAAGTLPEFGR